MKNILVTNNPYFQINGNMYEEKIEYLDYDYLNLLYFVRDKVHLGHRILTHPLSGSVKPNEIPYKSVIISSSINSIDFESLQIIENSIQVSKKFIDMGLKIIDEPRAYNDYEIVDLSLIKSFLTRRENE